MSIVAAAPTASVRCQAHLSVGRSIADCIEVVACSRRIRLPAVHWR